MAVTSSPPKEVTYLLVTKQSNTCTKKKLFCRQGRKNEEKSKNLEITNVL